ncbi:hypothetical protein DFS34DRAFT_321320 [Phlyctochytrium arcticum]|nr:hypothetical protein DFS34DRAFT_321320 [Phlyctochytrium arcticum]
MADSTLLLAYMALVLAAEREEEYEDHLRRNIWKSNQLDDRTFLRMFRMTRPDFVWLVDQLRDALYQDEDDDDDPLSVETQVAVSLYYLGHGSAWSKLDELFGLDEGVAESTVRRFTTAVQAMNLSNNVVGVPAHTDIAAWDEISQRFLKKGGIPGVVGVIDTMPVPIKDPGYKRWLWLNRRGWPSIVVQAIVDAEGNFQDCTGARLHACPVGSPHVPNRVYFETRREASIPTRNVLAC